MLSLPTKFFLVALSILPCCILASLSVSPVTLTTTLGNVIGLRKLAGNGQPVDVYYDIPFAKPPVGELRFKPPVAADPWQGFRDGTQKPNSCWQNIDENFNRFPGVEMWNPNTLLSENCLYLNVWRPESSDCNNATSFNAKSINAKSIMVWIYGGGFYSGTSTLDVYDATELAGQNDVIVVSFGYRLGALGFLSLDNDVAPGNAGLLDQVMALQWVKDNAEFLGGSADAITLFGESAGAASVGFHLLSPLSRDLFTYAIMESASPIAQWAVIDVEQATSEAKKLAKILSCSAETDEEIEACLMAADPKKLTEKQGQVKPVVDGHFLPDEPEEMLSNGEVKRTSVIVGVNKNEGTYFMQFMFLKYFPFGGDGEISEEQFNNILRVMFENDVEKVNSVKNFYRRTNPKLNRSETVDAILGDIRFKCPVIDFADLYSEAGGQVFVYSFEHRVSTNPWPEWFGVAHGYEIEVVFGLPLANDSVYTHQEKELSTKVMDYFTSFAQTGNPNTEDTQSWPEYTSDERAYVIIDSDGARESRDLRHQECSFWFCENME